MRLEEALAINRGDVVSFVGAGGKTTAMFRLAHELVNLGWRVVTTTTTLIRPPTEEQSETVLLESDPQTLLRRLESIPERHVTVASGQKADAKGKLIGIPLDLVGQIAALPSVDAVIVEADGARGLSLKAPAPHEPPIPSATSVVVPMMGVDAIGRPLDEESAHRPELVALRTGISLGEPITPEAAATLLAHPEGGLKNVPPSSRVIPLINKVTPSTLHLAQGVAQRLMAKESIHRVVLGAALEPDPVLECWTKVAGVVLAAGGSSRLGRPKQLLPLGGKSMIEHVADVALASSLQEVIVVLGHKAEEIHPLLEGKNLQLVTNRDWSEGLSSSLQAGLAVLPPQFEACLFLLADQPRVTPQLLDMVLARYRQTLAPIVAPRHQGRRGNPVLFSRSLFPEMPSLQGDEGGRLLLERHAEVVEWVDVESEEYFLDIDTPEDLERWRGRR